MIGWERERLRKPAGFRTHILVGIGSSLVMMVSLSMRDLFPGASQVDPGRIAAQVVVGIGFLGAGTILRSQEGFVSGLTTAASLWVVSGIGLAVGCGFWSAAILATLFVFVVLNLMNRVDDFIERHLFHSVILQAKPNNLLLERAKEALAAGGVMVLGSEIRSETGGGKYVVVHFRPIRRPMSGELSKKLSRLPGVQGVFFH